MFTILSVSVTSVASVNGLSIHLWTDRPTYFVGESWDTVSWTNDAPCVESTATGVLTIEGPTANVKVKLDGQQLMSGSYMPSIGQPWAPTEVGSWTVQLTVSNTPPHDLDCSGSTNFLVVMPIVRQ